MYVPSSRPSASSANVQCATSARAWFDAIEVLAPVLDPLQGAPEPARGQRDDQLLARREELLPEAAADVVRLDAHEVRRHAGHPRDRVLRLVRVLRAHPRVQLAGGRFVLDDDAARLHRHGRVPVLAEGAPHHARAPRAALPARVRPGTPSPRRDSCRARDARSARRRRARARRRRRRARRRCRPRRARPRPRRRSGSRRRSARSARRRTARRRRRAGAAARPASSSSIVGCIEPARVEVGGGEHRDDAVAACRAASTSTRMMRPRATSLRTNVQCNMPGSTMSST